MTTSLVKESFLYQLFTALLGLYRESALKRTSDRIGDWCMRQIDESHLLRFLFKERAVSRDWETSLLCRVLTFCVSLPGHILHLWYTAWKATFEDSFFARLVFSMGESTSWAEGWLAAAMWVIPFAYWDNRYSLGAFAFLLVLFHAGAMRRKNFRLDFAPVGFLPTVFFSAVVLGLLLSYRPDLSVRFFGYHTAAALCVLVTVSAVRNADDLKRLCAGASVCVGASGAYGIFTRIQGVEVVKAFVDAKLNPDMPGRVQSYFDNPNQFAEVLVILLPLTLALVLCSRTTARKIVAALVWLVGVAALLMTYSRAGWLGFALSFLLIVFWLRPALFPLLIAFCIVAVPLLPSAVLTRMLTIVNMNDTTTSSRFPLYQAALRVIRRSPFTGAGLGADTVKKYISNHYLYRGKAPFVHAHNLYLQAYLETGLLGVTSLLASLYWAAVRGGRTVRRARPSPERTLTACAVAGVCGIALCAMADFPWHYPRVQVMFWYLFAVALAGVKVCGMTDGEKNALTRPVKVKVKPEPVKPAQSAKPAKVEKAAKAAPTVEPAKPAKPAQISAKAAGSSKAARRRRKRKKKQSTEE